MIVTVNPKPTALAGDDKAVCAGGSVKIGGEAAVAGYTYSWSPTAGLDVASSAQPTATPSVTTTYTVTKTKTATGCLATDSMIVTVKPKPTALAGDDKAVCAGGSVQIGGEAAVAGYTYSWSPSTGLDVASSAQPTATPSVTTTYTVTKTKTATGCLATDSMIVTVKPKPTALAGDDKAVCAGGSVQIGGEAAVAGYTYSWSPTAGLDVASSAQPTATPSVTTTYTVTKTYTATGCLATDSMIVTVNPKPTALAGDDKAVCAGGSVQIGGEAAVAGYTYSWSPSTGLDVASSAQPTATPSVTTTYTVTKTKTATGCFATDSMIVTVKPKPTALAGDDKAVCAGGSVQIGGEAAVAGYTYSWSPSAGLDVASSAQPTATPSVTTTYTVTKTKTATGCLATDSMIVTVNPKPTALAGDDKAVCAGGSVQIGGEAAVAGYTYSWSPSAGLDVASSAQPTATPASTTTYTVTKTYTATGCFATDSMIVTVNLKPTALAGDDKEVCVGGSVQIGGEAAEAGYTYSWSPTAGLDDASSAQPTATPASTTTYILTKTKTATGCFATDSMIVTVKPKPTALAGDDKSVCVGGSVKIGGEAAVAGYTYSWSPTAGLDVASSAQPTATPSVTTTYTVTKTYTATGCFATDSMIVTVNPKPTALAGDDKAVCAGGSVQIGGEAAETGYTYSWSPTAGLDVASSAQPTATPSVTTTYTVTKTYTATGCLATDSMIVTVNPKPTALAGDDKAVCAGGSVQIGGEAAETGYTYSWSPTAGLDVASLAQPTATPSVTTTYTVTKTNTATGCLATDSMIVTVNPKPTALAGDDKAGLCRRISPDRRRGCRDRLYLFLESLYRS